MYNLKDFIDRLKCFPQIFDDLNKGCSFEDFIKIEKNINQVIPDDLKELYLSHNGQGNKSKGIFKVLSGFDKYSRPKFLSLIDMCDLYIEFCNKDYLKIVFDDNMIPFAVDNRERPDDVLCYDINTGEIILLWVLYYDLFSPIEWQLSRIKQSNSLDEFLKIQNEFYKI